MFLFFYKGIRQANLLTLKELAHKLGAYVFPFRRWAGNKYTMFRKVNAGSRLEDMRSRLSLEGVAGVHDDFRLAG